MITTDALPCVVCGTPTMLDAACARCGLIQLVSFAGITGKTLSPPSPMPNPEPRAREMYEKIIGRPAIPFAANAPAEIDRWANAPTEADRFVLGVDVADGPDTTAVCVVRDGKVEQIIVKGGSVLTKPVISSIRINVPGGQHAHIDVWNRGALSGSLTVKYDDAAVIVAALARSDDAASCNIEVEGPEHMREDTIRNLDDWSIKVRNADVRPWENRIEDDDRGGR